MSTQQTGLARFQMKPSPDSQGGPAVLPGEIEPPNAAHQHVLPTRLTTGANSAKVLVQGLMRSKGVCPLNPTAQLSASTSSNGRSREARVSVIIPTLNEAGNLPYVLNTIPAWVGEIVIVDGRSDDDTERVAKV